MSRFPSRFRRLDDILADLPIEDPMLLSELDGYLTGVTLSPEALSPDEWLPPIWGGSYGEGAPFDDPIDVQLFADMVQARHGEIARDLARGKLNPIFDVDERNGEVLWDIWILGFELAIALRPERWRAIATGDDAAAAAIGLISGLADIANNVSELTSMEINEISDAAPAMISAATLSLRTGAVAMLPAGAARAVKVGRNDPCPCGSGRKHKRCCGAG